MSSRFTPSARIGKEDMEGRKYHLIVSVHFFCACFIHTANSARYTDAL